MCFFYQSLSSSDLRANGISGELNANYREEFSPFILHYFGAVIWFSSKLLPSPSTTHETELATQTFMTAWLGCYATEDMICFSKAEVMTVVLNEFSKEAPFKMQHSTRLMSISPMLYNLSELPIAIASSFQSRSP